MATINPIGSNKPIEIAFGGTNATTMATTDGVVYYDGTRLVTTAAGTATNVLTSNGAGVAPTFQAAGGGSNPAASDSFFAYLSANQTALGNAQSTVGFDTTKFNNGGFYNAATFTFTAPADGTYFFGTLITSQISALDIGPGYDNFWIQVNAGTGTNQYGDGLIFFDVNGLGGLSAYIATLIQLSATDTVKVVYFTEGFDASIIKTASPSTGYKPATYFFGYRLF